MAGTSQPHFLSSLVSGFSSLVRDHGFAVNLVAVAALAVIGASFLTGRRDVVRPALAAFLVLCFADWVLIEDFGFLGGLGTDPNSMIPMALLAAGGFLALTRVPAAVTAPAAESVAGQADPDADSPDVTVPEGSGSRGGGWRRQMRPTILRGALGRSLRAATFGTMTSVAAFGVIVIGAVPMAAAQATPGASTILAQAIDGNSSPINIPAPGFTLTDQHGRTVTLSSLRGKVVLLTFLDPVCVTDCPLIAQEFRQAGQLLGTSQQQVDLVAVDVNPLYNELAYTRQFDQQEGLASLTDWHYLTSSPARLRAVYKAYGQPAQTLPAGAMLGHSDIAFVIDTHGEIREELDMNPGPGTVATKSSFATELASAATQTLRTS
jgi:cytochrome oxidase Cu insertion factor (SCO1/SenC/PrrC family)